MDAMLTMVNIVKFLTSGKKITKYLNGLIPIKSLKIWLNVEMLTNKKYQKKA